MSGEGGREAVAEAICADTREVSTGAGVEAVVFGRGNRLVGLPVEDGMRGGAGGCGVGDFSRATYVLDHLSWSWRPSPWGHLTTGAAGGVRRRSGGGTGRRHTDRGASAFAARAYDDVAAAPAETHGAGYRMNITG